MDEDKIRVVTLLSEAEKKWLQMLALRAGRSMSGYLRHLLNEEIEANLD